MTKEPEKQEEQEIMGKQKEETELDSTGELAAEGKTSVKVRRGAGSSLTRHLPRTCPTKGRSRPEQGRRGRACNRKCILG